MVGIASYVHINSDLSWEFPKIRGTLFWGPFLIRILLFRVLY